MRKSYKDDHENNVKFYTDISTYTDSYRIFKDVQAERFRNRRENTEKPKLKRLPMTSIDLETFTPLKHKIPLGLMIVPNEVTRGNPQASIQHIEIPEDSRKKEVIKTRPRICQTPQVSLDNVSDPEIRKNILNYIYTTELQQSQSDFLRMVGSKYREVPESVLEHEKFLSNSNKHCFTVQFKPKPLLQAMMTPEKNSKAREWEHERAKRGISVSTEHFWKHNEPKFGPTYSELNELVKKETVNEISDLINKDQLEIQYDKTCQGYAGFKSSVPVGMGLRKEEKSHHHPFRSTYQEAFNWKCRPKDDSKTIS